MDICYAIKRCDKRNAILLHIMCNAKEEEIYNEIKQRYDDQTKPYYAASRLWIDAIIDPKDTRKWISMGIEAANKNPEIMEYKTGIIQT